MRTLRLTLATLAALAGLAGCGSTPHHHAHVPTKLPTQLRIHAQGAGTGHCHVPLGQGVMGACSPRALLLARPAPPAALRQGGAPGADTSNFQGCITPRGLGFIIAKIGEGGRSPFYDRFGTCTWDRARAIGVVAGNYWFDRNCYSARAQADTAAAWTAGRQSSLPLWLDYETNDCGLSNQAACDHIRAFDDEYLLRTGLHVVGVYDAPGLWPGCGTLPRAKGWVASLGNNCRSVLSGFPDGGMTICQYTFTGPYGGDGDVWLRGSPVDLVREAHGPPAPPPVPPEVQALNARIKVLWGRRDAHRLHAYGSGDLDYRLRRIYALGWSPHTGGPRHDWTGKESRPSSWAERDGREVVKRWAKGRHGAYVQQLTQHAWCAEHVRFDAWLPHVVRLPGNVNPPGSPRCA